MRTKKRKRKRKRLKEEEVRDDGEEKGGLAKRG